MEQPYWGVDFPGMDEEEAQRVAAWAEANLTSLFAEPMVIDPRDSLTWVMDRDTVVLLVEAFELAEIATGDASWANMRTLCQRWLALRGS